MLSVYLEYSILFELNIATESQPFKGPKSKKFQIFDASKILQQNLFCQNLGFYMLLVTEAF